MQETVNQATASMQQKLEERKENSLYRYLQVMPGLVDFCSNDYLSFARNKVISERIDQYCETLPHLTGATGSRSISGNTAFAESLEMEIARFHKAEAGLIFNSGYDANVGLFSCIAAKGDILICDELIHASIIDGCRLSYAGRLKFLHNDTGDLRKKLQHARKECNGNIFVAVESVYSMDGDMSPLEEIISLCDQFGANLVVDEAHATGVFGKDGKGLVVQLGLEDRVFARVVTFGKAMGCHGAIVLGSSVLRNYLINFARSFIFTTALPAASLYSIKSAYEQLSSEQFSNEPLHALIAHFRSRFIKQEDCHLIDSLSPVQSVVIAGNEKARSVSSRLQAQGYDVRAILSPSVPKGKERLRISLHLHNSPAEIDGLTETLNHIIRA